MLNIKNLLSPFTKLHSPEFLVQKAVQEAIQNIVNINIEKKHIVLQNSVVFIQSHPTIKHACSLKKENLLEYIKKTLPQTISVKDIR